MHE
ncbi:unnamed protein product, partial [Didymodactylos carnosus]|jgi:hypothetical protein